MTRHPAAHDHAGRASSGTPGRGDASTHASPTGGRGIALPGILLGIGMGGFLDGIVLHQVLQWHHMLTSASTANIPIGDYPPTTVHGLRMNTLWDGLFHTLTWLCVLGGLGLLYSRVVDGRGAVWRSRELWGWMLAGWGLFNLVEGIVDHHLLGIHHVMTGRFQLIADLAFLALGAVLLVGGRALAGTSGAAGSRA